MDYIYGSYYGSIVSDALGGPYEFSNKNKINVTDEYRYNYNFNLPPGSWTDDTSMMLCMSKSLIELGRFDAKDQLDRYLEWFENGYMSVNGKCFDIGDTTRLSLYSYKRFGSLTSIFNNKKSSGNGSLMRLTCIPIFYRNKSYEECVKFCKLSSITTHSSQLCVEACEILGGLVHIVLNTVNRDKKELINILRNKLNKEMLSEEYHFIFDNTLFTNFLETEPKSSGFVVNSIKCCLFSFLKYDNFKDSIINIVKLGDDADTNACITGILCGAFYGFKGIPEKWLNGIQKPYVLLDNINYLVDK
jgi:ADP-ribosyl-[dinitrogen reductase] hydrolase